MKALVTAAVAALVLCGSALADVWQIHRTAAGDKAARAVVITHADLGGAAGWTGGFVKPDLSNSLSCSSYKPKQSDLIVVGAAETKWQQPGIQLDDAATVLKTPQMVALDWQRTVIDARVEPCLRQNVAKQVPAHAKLVSFGRVALPKLAQYSRAYRAVIAVQNNGQTVNVDTDVLVLGMGHTEISLTVFAPSAVRSQMHAAEIRLGKLLVARAR